MIKPFCIATTTLALLAGACGGSAPTDSGLGKLDCSPLMPCGGNLDGTWTLRGQCVKDSNRCAGAVYDYSMSGSTLKFEGRFITVTGGGSAHDTIPQSCLSPDADGGACDEVKDRPGYSCQAGGSSCDCNIDLTKATPTAIPMSYVTSGTQFLVGTLTYSYCVFQGVLRIALDTPGSGDGPVAEYVKR